MLRVPLSIWNRLYRYQKEGVKWLWKLHSEQCGGILGDEMGLGKTIQIIAFIAGLKISNLPNKYFKFKGLGPVIVVCPTTLMWQWMKELDSWFPHIYKKLLDSPKSEKESLQVVKAVAKHSGILLCTYSGLLICDEILNSVYWHYVILDEGHKIRNPDSKTTLRCKRFRTPHRIIISGSPIQNNLRELWSLFDFIFPGKLGSLERFTELFGIPIQQGGYANASKVQVQIAYKCATLLKNVIKPHLLRRLKSDHCEVNLPSKNEHVLFCQLTDEQIQLYQDYLNSDECGAALCRESQIFVAVSNLRKICNHPDLFISCRKSDRRKRGRTSCSSIGRCSRDDEREDFKNDYFIRSGKMSVVQTLLNAWNKQAKKVLLFSQSRQMLDILEAFLTSEKYTYLRMDGATSASSRQGLIESFNENESIFIFLLTTRVGGLGLNLTSASRVVIYDPDWNPSIDTQARERVWRIGDSPNKIFMPISSSSSYRSLRQVYKQFLAEKVLMNPKQKRFFKSNDLHDLFNFEVKIDREDNYRTETEELLCGSVKCIRHTMAVPSKTDIDKSSNEKHERIMVSAEKQEKKCVEIEGVTVPFINQCETTAAAYLRQMEGKDALENADEYLLNQLLKAQTVQCALEHDSIVKSDDLDYALIELEAESYAKEAAKELIESRKHCFSALSGIPNSTKKSRHCGDGNNGCLNQEGSKQILARIRERKAPTPHRLLTTPKLPHIIMRVFSPCVFFSLL